MGAGGGGGGGDVSVLLALLKVTFPKCSSLPQSAAAAGSLGEVRRVRMFTRRVQPRGDTADMGFGDGGGRGALISVDPDQNGSGPSLQARINSSHH